MAKALVAASIPCIRPDTVARLDEAAFSSLYRGASRALWSYVYRVTGNAADADDIVQEAFLRLLRADLGPTEEDWRRYLYRVASNLVVDRWRSRQRQDQHEERSVGSAAVDGGGRVSGSADADRDVARTFAELTPRKRALLWLALRGRREPRRDCRIARTGAAQHQGAAVTRAASTARLVDRERAVAVTNWFELKAEDEQAIAAFMARVAALPTALGAPDATQLWWKAQLLRRWDAERRAVAPFEVMQPFEIAAGLGAAGFLSYLSLPYLF